MKAELRSRRDTSERVGAKALLVLGTSPNATLLGSLGEEAMTSAALQERLGSPASTLRVRLKELLEIGAIAQRDGRTGNSCEYGLTPAGEDLISVIEIAEGWLLEAPGGSMRLGANRSKAAIGALTEGWSSALLRAVAAGPLSIAELDGLISTLNYPSLERRMAAMRRAGQVEAQATGRRETPYAVTDWLRRGVAPLLAAIRWERRHLSGAKPLGNLDMETIFLLAIPLLELEGHRSGVCRLAVELPVGGNGHDRIAGVVVEITDRTPSFCTPRLDGNVDAWSSGSVSGWLAALIDDDQALLELGGDCGFARDVVAGLHRALFVPVAHRGNHILA